MLLLKVQRHVPTKMSIKLLVSSLTRVSPAGDCGGGRSSPFYRLLTPPASCCWLQATLLAFLSAVTQQSLLTAPVDFHRNLPLDVEIPSIRDPVKILRRIKSFL